MKKVIVVGAGFQINSLEEISVEYNKTVSSMEAPLKFKSFRKAVLKPPETRAERRRKKRSNKKK